ncbi:DUF2971 domain-containing protein [Vibrio alginolyticus]
MSNKLVVIQLSRITLTKEVCALDEKQIGKFIKGGQFSKLDLLYDEKLLEENENYYGFLYFLLDKRSIDTSNVLKKIEQKKGSLGLAYEYLGYVASKVFPDFNEYQIPASFFRLATELEPQCSNAWWGLFKSAKECKALLKSLKLDHANNEFNKIKNKLSHYYIYFKDLNFTHDEWLQLMAIIKDNEVYEPNSTHSLLIRGYYHLGLYEDGLTLINDSVHVDMEILNKYYEDGLISQDCAISKLYDFELERFLKDDYERIYQEYLNRDTSGKLNMTKLGLMQKAFRAKKYDDVIAHNDRNSEHDIVHENDLEPKLYVAISQIYLNKNIDPNILIFIRENEYLKDNRNKTLYKLFRFKYLMSQLFSSFRKRTSFDFPISVNGTYQKLESYLEDADLLSHYLCDELYRELEVLTNSWNDKYFDEKITSIKNDMNGDECEYDDFIELCNLGIHKHYYSEVIKKVEAYHERNSPTVSTYNILGVCFERQGLHIESYAFYKKSIDLMDKYNEYSTVIISNYLSSMKRVKSEIDFDSDHYNSWREQLNVTLLESFKWHDFIPNRNGCLYKYSPFNLNTLDSLINKYFYLPKKSQLNDPIEMPILDNIGEDKLVDSQYRICSFSKNSNSMLMWSHYTQNHEGIMVEYQFCGDLPTKVGIGKVKYTNDGKRNKEQNKYIFNQFLLTKNKEWSYEEEVRLMSYKEDKVYYDRYEYPNPDRTKINAEVVSITLGVNFDESKVPLIISFIKSANGKRKEYENKIKLKRAVISENNIFGLEYVNIDIC